MQMKHISGHHGSNIHVCKCIYETVIDGYSRVPGGFSTGMHDVSRISISACSGKNHISYKFSVICQHWII